MMAQFALMVALLATVSARLNPASSDSANELKAGKSTFCTSPVSKAEVVFPESLAGRANTDFKMYSGYVPVTEEDFYFYWFFGARDGNTSAPLVVWTNGGPGCTSMEGATTETGPLSLFDIKESCTGPQCDYTGQLSTNAYAWNAHANVVYLDQPKNVGYSFGTGSTKSSVQAASDFVVWYNKWLVLFPEFASRELIIAGESYGGHYVPAWAGAILDFNEAATTTNDAKINLAGVVIGNGCVNNTVQNSDRFVDFTHAEKLIADDSHPKSESTARVEMSKYLGYTPNYYDYRIQSITCTSGCYGYNYTAWSYWFLQPEVLDALHICGDAGVDAFAGSAGGCISMGAFDSNDQFSYSGAIARTLEQGIPVTFYFGKQDTACNYVGGMAMAESLPWSKMAAWNAVELSPLVIAGVEAGQTKSLGGLTFMQVEGAGHMVPMDQPAASATALLTILKQLQ